MKSNLFVLIGLIALLLITSVLALPSWLIFDKKVEHEHKKRQDFPLIFIGGVQKRESEGENPDKLFAEL